MSQAERELLLRQVDTALRTGDLAKAVDGAERALAIGVEHPLLFNLVAHHCVEQGEFDRAVALLNRAHTLAPRDVHVLNTLGIAYKRMGKFSDAAQAFDAAVAVDPNYANGHFNKATALEGMGALDEARLAYEKAVALEPGFADALGRLSYLAAMRGDYDAALVFAERVANAVSNQPSPALTVAEFATMRGDHEAGMRFARMGLERNPGDPTATLVLARAELNAGEAQSAKHRLQALLDAGPQPGDTRALALSQIARAEELADDNAAAFRAYAESKAELQRNYAQYRTQSGTVYMDRVQASLRYFEHVSPNEWEAKRGAAAVGPASAHVFLVGFPRSGTTLLENSLAAHPAIATMEEEESFADLINDVFMCDGGWERLEQADDATLARYRDAYWRTCRAAVPGLDGRIFIDKMPLNTVMLPFVAKLFPDAKIVFTLRDPRDVVLSCLKQQFALSAAMYEFCTLDGAARFYDAVMRLAAIYRDRLGLEILDTRYEDLVADFDGATRRICDFLGIEWNEAMRDVKASARSRAIATPSAAQVARGLYDGSGAWRNFRTEMAPVLPILAPWVEKFGYAKD